MNPRARRHRRNLRAIRRSEHSRLTHVLQANVEAACSTTPVNKHAILDACNAALFAASEAMFATPPRHPNHAPLKAERDAIMRCFGISAPVLKMEKRQRLTKVLTEAVPTIAKKLLEKAADS